MKELITRRSGAHHFIKMTVIRRFCEERFGKPNCFYTWDGNFADNTNDYWAFQFWDESMATFLKLTYPDLMTREEFDTKEYI